jgi:hypothetical protein
MRETGSALPVAELLLENINAVLRDYALAVGGDDFKSMPKDQ